MSSCKHKDHKIKETNRDKFEKLNKLKVKDLCVKNMNSVNIKTKTMIGITGMFSNLTSENAKINNLNVTSINGVNTNCINSPFNISGIITPVEYINGQPQQPPNPGNFNQTVLNDLWQLNLLSNRTTNLDSDSGRLRNTILSNFYGCTGCPSINLSNCSCPIPGYAVFIGSINASLGPTGVSGPTGTILTVSNMLNESLTDCPASIGIIEIGQIIFLSSNSSFLSSTIVSQISGVSGGIGSYLISNNFNDYSKAIPSQKMLSLSSLILNDCVNVPLRIYGVETLSVSNAVNGVTGICHSIISAISYNLNIANKTLGSRIAAVYVQVGWQITGNTGSTGSTNVQGISIDSRQFDPSILSFGEQMNNNVLLPTELINSIAIYNLFTNVINSVVQLVVYVEDGLEVFIPEAGSSSISKSSRNFKSVQISSISSPSTNFAAAFDETDMGIPLPPIPIPENAKTMRFNAFGGGGGGGGGTNYFNSGAGGGGGSGYPAKPTGDIIIDLTFPINKFTVMIVSLGKGGAPETDGGMTTVTLVASNSSQSFGAAGGKKGNSPNGLYSGKGGDGYFGGGGGGKVGTYINDGGAGSQGSSCANGTSGSSINGDGGLGGYIVCGQGGQKGLGICIENCGGGGGGGGLGGGKGGDGYGAGSRGDEAINGGDATGKAAGGGGAGYTAKLGGRGANGYIDGPYFTF